MRIIVFLIALGCVFVARAGWQLTFADEFNGQTMINSTTWLTAYYFAPGTLNTELQFYSPGGFTFGSDYLRIVGEQKDINGFEYQSGVITTNGRFSQTFGYFEIRARWTSGRGLWPAFWLYGQYGKISQATEIDILEALLQNPETAHLTYHCTNGSSYGAKYTGQELADQSWHTYSVQWTPDIIIWYVDGIARFNVTVCVPKYPMIILANMAIGGWPGPPNATTPFPAYMDVDYIRAYKYVANGGVSLTGPGEGLPFTMPTLPALPSVSFGAPPTVTPNNADRGDNVTFTFSFNVNTALTNANLVMQVQSWMNTNSSEAKFIRTAQWASLKAGTTQDVSFTVTIPDTLEDGYYRVVWGVFNNGWNLQFTQSCVAVLGINSIVGGREMPAAPTDGSTPLDGYTPSTSSNSPSASSSPSTPINSSASVIEFGYFAVFSTVVQLLW